MQFCGVVSLSRSNTQSISFCANKDSGTPDSDCVDPDIVDMRMRVTDITRHRPSAV